MKACVESTTSSIDGEECGRLEMSHEPHAEPEDLREGALPDTIVGIEGAKRLAAQLRDVFDDFDDILHLMRAHPLEHPLLDQRCEQVMESFSRVLEREHVVRVVLQEQCLETEQSLRFFDQDIAKHKEFIWKTPYTDGIVFFEFRYGMPYKELRAFLSVMHLASRGGLGEDHDTVSRLWELDFEHLSFDSVEGFADHGVLEELGVTGPAAAQAISEALVTGGHELRRKATAMFEQGAHPKRSDLVTRRHLKTSEQLHVPRMRDDDLAYALVLHDTEQRELAREWTHSVALEFRLIEVLLSSIRATPLGEEAERAGALIARITQQLTEQEKFHMVAEVLTLMRSRQEYFAESIVDPLRALIRQLTSSAYLGALLHIFLRDPEKRDDLMELFQLLDARAVQTEVIHLMGSAEPLRAERALLELLLDLSVGPLEGELTRPENVQQKHYLTRLLHELRRRSSSENASWAPAQHLLRAGLEHSWRHARLLSLEVEHPLWENTLAAETYLKKLAFDEDKEVRQRAMAKLAHRHRAVFLLTIREALSAQDFSGRSPGEIRFLMRAYIEHEPNAPTFLMELLEPRGWIGSGKRAFAKLAATVLVEANHMETIEFLRGRANSMLTQPELKEHFRRCTHPRCCVDRRSCQLRRS
ncbi:MAG: hypothetical protein AAGI01_13260, partial [Myxococcota bacterium]